MAGKDSPLLSIAANLIVDLSGHLRESHQEEIDNNHGGDAGTCTYCETLDEAQAFLDLLIKEETRRGGK